MVRDHKKFLKFSEAERRKWLENLTYRQSVKLTEGLLSSSLIRKMHFRDDDHPIALFKQVELNRKRPKR